MCIFKCYLSNVFDLPILHVQGMQVNEAWEWSEFFIPRNLKCKNNGFSAHAFT